MREFPQPEILDDLNVLPLNTSFAIGRILRGGLHAYLAETVEEHPEADVLAYPLPTLRRQTLFIAASYEANRRYQGAELHPDDPIDRHPTLTGIGTTASKIFDERDSDRPGIILSSASEGQGFINQLLRHRLNPSKDSPTVVDDVAQEAFELIVDSSRAGVGAYDACLVALETTLSPVLLGRAVDGTELLKSKGLEMAALSGLLRSLPLARSLMGLLGRPKTTLDNISPTLSNHDALSSIAGIRVLANAVFWALYNYSQRPDTPIPSLVRETLIDAAPAVTMVRAQLHEDHPDAFFIASPFAALVHPMTFSAEHFRGEENIHRDKMTEKIPFGGGRHVCPANKSSLLVLNSILQLARAHPGGLTFIGKPRPNPTHLVSKTPTRGSQGDFIF